MKSKEIVKLFFTEKSEDPESLKHSISYAQALRLKRICTEFGDFKASCDIVSKRPIDKGYKRTEMYDSISKTFGKNTEDLLTQNNERKYRIPLT